ncbi:integral membrane protein [Phlyctema vagabunda]|uniref:Integral membrane protein n=1 Tax=Phlyctema vagabunda TaxID=108571 RepID=A0ABR4PBJ9_9HELO
MVALPAFRSHRARQQEKENETAEPVASANNSSDRTLTPTHEDGYGNARGVDIKRATRKRRNAILVSSFLFFLSVIFLILTIIGNTSRKAVIRRTYFFKLDLTNLIPASTPSDIQLVNSLARSLGLHDFYQVGLWNFCEGYNSEGITKCSTPKSLYWFNPVEILLNELLSGATIALPADINKILSLIRIASHLMFGFFITGVCTNFVSIFIAPVCVYSRWISFPFAIFTFISALLTTAAAIIATVMFSIFKNVITAQAGLNIGAELGTEMLAYMWIGAGSSILAWLIHLCLACCCASRRDVKRGKKRGAKAAYGHGDAANDEKKKPVRRRAALPNFGRKRTTTSSDVV